MVEVAVLVVVVVVADAVGGGGDEDAGGGLTIAHCPLSRFLRAPEKTQGV